MSPHFRETLPDAVTLPELFRTSGYLAARGKALSLRRSTEYRDRGPDDYRSWDLTINCGRDREILDRVFSLKPGQFGATLSWLPTMKDAEHTDRIAAAERWLLERFKRNKESFFLGVGFISRTPTSRQSLLRYPRDRIALPVCRMRTGRALRRPRIEPQVASRNRTP
jgi:uncharacterized sulfatase